MYPSGGFSSKKVNRVNRVHESDRSRFPSIFQLSSLRRSSITSKGRLSVQSDEGKCRSLKWTRNRFLLHRHSAMSLEKVMVKTRMILPEDFLVVLLGLGGPKLGRMFSKPDFLQIV